MLLPVRIGLDAVAEVLLHYILNVSSLINAASWLVHCLVLAKWIAMQAALEIE